MYEHLTDKNLALDLVRVTEAAALAAAHYFGKGDRDAVNEVAADAMRIAFQGLHIRGTVIIGEGDREDASMLYTGDSVGYGDGPELDVVLDAVEGSGAVANGRLNAVSVVGVAQKDSMFRPGRSLYCKKIVTGAEAAGVIDLDAPVKDNLMAVARAVGKPVTELNVYVLDNPRHKKLVQDIRISGARVNLHDDGDIAGALMAVDPRSNTDLMMGIGGTAAAVIAACAIKGSGGQILMRFDPATEEERSAMVEDGVDFNVIYGVDDLITSEQCFFAATGVSEGEVLSGVQYHGEYAVTTSLTTRGRTGTTRYIQAWHNRRKLANMSAVAH